MTNHSQANDLSFDEDKKERKKKKNQSKDCRALSLHFSLNHFIVSSFAEPQSWKSRSTRHHPPPPSSRRPRRLPSGKSNSTIGSFYFDIN